MARRCWNSVFVNEPLLRRHTPVRTLCATGTTNPLTNQRPNRGAASYAGGGPLTASVPIVNQGSSGEYLMLH
eukprot:890696-Heterocapsa_arctica.AAC.1